jgi:hypothetical protein
VNAVLTASLLKAHERRCTKCAAGSFCIEGLRLLGDAARAYRALRQPGDEAATAEAQFDDGMCVEA